MRVLNLNFYERTTVDKATLGVVLPGTNDTVYYRGKDAAKSKPLTIEDLNNGLEWSKDKHVDTSGTPSNYITLVNWWFAEALKNGEYREHLNKNYADLGNIAVEINKAKTWLVKNATNQNTKGEPTARRSNLNKYLKGRLAKARKRNKGR